MSLQREINERFGRIERILDTLKTNERGGVSGGAVPSPANQGDMLAANATPAWAVLPWPGGAGYALTTTGTDPAWDQTPQWTGLHNFAAGLTVEDDQPLNLGTGLDAIGQFVSANNRVEWTGVDWLFDDQIVNIGTVGGGGELLAVRSDQNSSFRGIEVVNEDGGAAATALLHLKNTSGAGGDHALTVGAIGTGYTTAAPIYQDSGILQSGINLSGGLTIRTIADANIYLATAATTENMRLNSSGIVVNAATADLDFSVYALAIADALLVRGSDGQITLGALGAGAVQSSAGGVLSSGPLPLTDLANYAQGSIIRGGAVDWEAHAAETNHFILVGDGTDITSKAFDWDDISAGAGADMVHDHSASSEGGSLIVGTTDTDATAGSVFFAGTAGVLQQDNSSLFWDDTNNSLGIRSNSPHGTADALYVPWIAGDTQKTSYFGSGNVNNNQIAVYCESYSNHGIFATTNSGIGVWGSVVGGTGGFFTATTGTGLTARLSGVGTAIANFQDNVTDVVVIQDGGHLDIAEYLRHLNDTDTYWRFQTDQATLACGGVTMIDAIEAASDYVNLFPSGGGSVGIGTATPGAILEAYGSTDVQLRVNSRGGNGFDAGWFCLANSGAGASVGGFMGWDGGDQAMKINGTTSTANDNLTVDTSGNVGIGTASQFGSGVGVLGIANAGTNPSANPTGGGVLYSDAGAGKWRGSGGTTTTFGPAEPHCDKCGRDFVVEWTNEKYGHLLVCMWCLTRDEAPGQKHRGVVRRTENWKEPGRREN